MEAVQALPAKLARMFRLSGDTEDNLNGFGCRSRMQRMCQGRRLTVFRQVVE